MSRGYIVIAQNNDSVDYLKQAYALALNLKATQTTVSNLTVEQLTEIVRTIIQESLQKCSVTGTMKGRAKVNLAVVGSVEANMQCDFDEEPEKVED